MDEIQVITGQMGMFDGEPVNARFPGVIFSSEKENWETPVSLFNSLDKEFHFTLDAAADDENHLCDKYFTKEMDGLSQPWDGEIVWCNPPYGRDIGNWVHKAATERAITVMLLPARTDTKWFHKYCLFGAEVRFIKGRLRFGNSDNNAPFPSILVIFRRMF